MESLIVTRDGDPVAAALVRVNAARFGLRYAYVRWGPLWLRKQQSPDFGVWREAVTILRSEYAIKRKMWLRIFPAATRGDYPFSSALSAAGFTRVRAAATRTMLLDLTPPLAQLRKGLEQKWRNCLNNAEKNSLRIVEGIDSELFDRFQVPYEQMISRKGLDEPGDFQGFRAIQRLLPDQHKLRVFLCCAGDEVYAGAIASALGERGIYHFGATADNGMRTKASYLLQWRIVEWLKERGCTEYDLHGVNRAKNPGVYNFKAGLCGKNGSEVEFLGAFDTYGSVRAALLAKAADQIVKMFPRLKQILTRSGVR